MTVVSNWQTIFSKNKKRLASVILAAALFLTGVAPSFAAKTDEAEIKPSAKISWEDAPAIEGTSAILMDAKSGEILYEKNAYEKRDPASIAKIMTCLVVLESLELNQEVISTIDFDGSTGGVGIEIKKGEVFTVEQLLYALMLSSANDAAEVLAIEVGGSIDNFSDMMNDRAAMCGAKDTHFNNPNGLNATDKSNVTTAYDLTLISREAMKNEMFRKIVGTVDYKLPKTNKSKARNLINVNRTVSDGESEFKESKGYTEYTKKGFYRYEGAIGVKTGYTSLAGDCFCGWAVKEDTTLIGIVLNSSTYETRFEDVIKLWDYGFEKYYTYHIANTSDIISEIPVKRGKKSDVNVSVKSDLDITLNADYKSKGITTEIDTPEKLTAPVKKGDEAGKLIVYKDGVPVAEEILIAAEDVGEGGILSYIGIADEDIMKFIVVLLIVIIALYALSKKIKKNQYRKKKETRARINRSIRRREWDKEKNPFD